MIGRSVLALDRVLASRTPRCAAKRAKSVTMPHALVAWWRRSPVAYALSTALTFNAFALPLVFVVSSVGGGFRYLALLVRR